MTRILCHPPGSCDEPVSLAVSIGVTISLLLYVLLALYDSSSAILLVLINNPGSVTVVVSYPADYKGARTVVVFSVIVDGSITVFFIVVINKVSGVVVVSITVTVFSCYPVVVIVLNVGAGTIVVSFVVVSVDKIEIETIVLDDRAFAVIVNNGGVSALDSTHPEFIWDRGITNNSLYWLIYGKLSLKI